ncbi:MAG: metal ABC transporter substrate-binding protein [Desulfobaccales bacterium]
MSNKISCFPGYFFRRFGWLVAVVLALTVQGASAAGKIAVTASILPLGDFCEKIGGDLVTVRVLIPPGASPHVFEPTPVAVAQALAGRVFVYVGAGLDPWAERLAKSHPSKNVIFVAAVQGIPLIKEVAHHHHEYEAHHDAGPGPPHPGEKREVAPTLKPHDHETGNPHIWLDPVLAKDICRRLAQAFIQADPAHRQEYERHLATYLAELDQLHAEITKEVAGFQLREYVTFHPAFTYFSRRYGLREAGVIEAAPGREPSPGHIQRIITEIKKTGVKAVFAEPQLRPRVAEVIAREAGVKVLLLDPLGGRPPYGSDYLKLMRHNLAILAQGLK